MIAGILHLTGKTKYGLTSRNVPIYLFRPFDLKQPPYIVGCSHSDTSANVLALVEATDMTQRIPRGTLIRILGKCGDWTAEREAIHWTHQPHRQPKLSCLEEPSSAGRLDLRGFQTIHVDPPGCKDVDDCVTFWDDKFVVTIADVGAWVIKNPQLLSFASNGQTLYDNGVAVRPMFPKELSEDKFSLRKGQDRFGVSIVYHPGREPVMMRTIVRVTHSYTYEEAVGLPLLRTMSEYISNSDLGDDPHKWIEALMVAYNSFMAKTLAENGSGIFRGHEKPDVELLERYNAICPEASRLAESAAVYQTYTDRTPHHGLGVDVYAHTTSPIRRWADVHNQMVLMYTFPTETIEQLNTANKRAKKHERDVFFLDQLRVPNPVNGVVLDICEAKTRVWVSDWKRVITLYRSDYTVGEKLQLDYYLDMNQPTWKKRMIISASRDCPESQCPEQVAL